MSVSFTATIIFICNDICIFLSKYHAVNLNATFIKNKKNAHGVEECNQNQHLFMIFLKKIIALLDALFSWCHFALGWFV